MRLPSTKRAAVILSFGAVVLFVAKLFVFVQTSSTTVLSDALESIINILASFVLIFIVHWGSRPADESHPYGHGRVDFLSALIEGALVAFASILILLRCAWSLYTSAGVQAEVDSITLLFLTIVANGLLGLLAVAVGRRDNSHALQAAGVHLGSDAVSTVGGVVALIAVRYTGISSVDPVIASLFAGYLLWTGARVVRRALSGLLDEVEPRRLASFVDAAQSVTRPGIIRMHRLRMMRVGAYPLIDAHVVVPEFWEVHKAHDEVNRYEREILTKFSKGEGEIHFHLDPCGRRFCRECDLSHCPIRREPFESRELVTITSAKSIV